MRGFLRRRIADPLLLHGILGWLTVAPLVGGALYVGLVPLLRYAARRVAPAAEPAT